MANGKACIKCCCIIANASLQCKNCGALQLAYYEREERKLAEKEPKENANNEI